MNTDIRISVSFRNHRKRKRLKMVLGEGATDYLLDLWIGTAMNRPSGRLEGFDKTDIAIEAGWEGDPNVFCEALVECGFLDIEGDGVYCLHDWEDHQPYVMGSEERSEKARNAARVRWGAKTDTRSNATSIPVACNEDAQGNAPSPSPSPSPDPDPDPDPNQKHKAYVGQKSADAPAVLGQKGEKQPQKPALVQFTAVVDLWNSILAPWGVPKVQELTSKRRAAIRKLWKDRPSGDFRVIETWEAFFSYCAKSKSLVTAGWFGFDWALNEGNLLKIVEGNYHGGRDKQWSNRRE